MVFGPAMDVARARKEGVPALHVLLQGNQLVISKLSPRSKLAFWCSNGPYWMLALALLASPPGLPAGCGAGWQHALAVLIVALASSMYHGLVLTMRPERAIHSVTASFTAILLGLDMIAANCYGVTLAWVFGLARCLGLFILPLMLLMTSAVIKRKGNPRLYALLHGVWHILSAIAMWRLLYFDQLGLPRPHSTSGP